MKSSLDPTLPEFEQADLAPQAPPKPPSSTDDWGAIYDRVQGQRNGAVADVLRATATESPEGTAEIDRLSRLLNQPPDLVKRNIEAFRKQAAEQSAEGEDVLTRAPKLAKWLVDNADRAAMIRDHVPAAVQLENKLTWGATLLRGWDSAQSLFGRFEQQIGDTLESIAGALPASSLTRLSLSQAARGFQDYGREVAEFNDEQARALGAYTTWRDVKDVSSFGQWLMEAVGTNLPVMAPIAAGSVAGGALAATAGVSATIGSALGAFVPTFISGVGETRGNLADQDPNAKAPMAVWVGGTAVAALDTVLPAKVGSRLVSTFGVETAEAIARRALLAPVKPQFLRRTVTGAVSGMATEGITEAFQEAFGQSAAMIGAGKPIDGAQIWDAMVEAGMAGGAVGALFEGGGEALTQHSSMRRYNQAIQQKAFFDALAAAGKEVPLASRSPEVYQELIAELTKGGPVEKLYIPADVFTEYFQDREISPELVAAELTGNPKALEEAAASGEDLAIPTAAYAAKLAVTEHHGFFARELKLTQDGLSARQAEEVKAELEKGAKAVQEAVAKAQENPEATPATPIRGRVVDQMMADPRFLELAAVQGIDPLVAATTYAAGVEAVFVTQGERAGKDPVALFDVYNLRMGARKAQAGTSTVQAPDGGPAVGLVTMADGASQAAIQSPTFDPEAVRVANATSRAGGAIGERALVPRLVEQLALPGETILDFGAGHQAVHATRLRGKGLDVTAHEFGANLVPGVHDPEALGRSYGLVYASNVLNVQSSLEMLRGTLGQIHQATLPGGRVILNLPAEPRKWDGLSAQLLRSELERMGFERIERIGGTNQAPVLSAYRKVAFPLGTALEQGALFAFTTEAPVDDEGGKIFFQSVATFEEQRRGWRQRFSKQAEQRGFGQDVIDDATSLIQAAVDIFRAYNAFPLEGGKKWVRQKGVKKQVWLKALVDNLDFGVTLDVDRTCKRVQQFWNTVGETEKTLQRPMSEDELLLLGQMMRADGDVPGCIFCYVEASRRAARRNKHLLATFTLDKIIEKADNSGRDDTAVVRVGEMRDKILTQLGWVKNGEVDLERWAALLTDDAAFEAALDDKGPLGQLAGEVKKFVLSAKGTAATGTATYNGELLRKKPEWVKEANERAGLRWLSATDFDPTQMVDTLMALADSTVIGLGGHEYTKEPWAVLVLGETGMKQNLSVALHGRTGPFRSDDVNGMPLGVALRLRNAHKNAGTMLVAKNLEQLIWGLTSPDIDMMIPHHAANWTGGAEKYGIFDLDDFSDVQHEHWADEAKAAKKHTVPVMKGGKQEKTKAGELKFRVKSPKEIHGKKLWFTYWLRRHGWDEQKAAAAYVKFCLASNITPKFAEGTYSDGVTKTRKAFPGFATLKADGTLKFPGYTKLLKDFARTDSPQEAVDIAKVDNKAMTEYLERYGGGDGWAFRSGAKPETIQKFLDVLAAGPVTSETLAQQEQRLAADPVPLNWVDTPASLGISGIPTRTAKTVRAGARNPGLLADLGPEDAGGAPGKTFYQSTPAPTVAEAFYSRLTAAVQASQLGKASGAQWKATIKNAKTGINADEFAFASIEDLEDGTTYAKQEVLEYLRAHELHVTITELGRFPSQAEVQARTQIVYDNLVREMVQKAEDSYGVQMAHAHVEENEDGTWSALVDDEVIDDSVESEQEALDIAEVIAETRHAETIDDMARDMVSWSDAEETAREQLMGMRDQTEFADYTFKPNLAEEDSYREVFIQAPAFGGIGFTELDVVGNMVMLKIGQEDPTWWSTIRTRVPEEVEEALRAKAKEFRELSENPGWLSVSEKNLVASGLEVLEKLIASRNFSYVAKGWKDGHANYKKIANPIVRLRFDTRELADGTRSMFLQEVQPPQEQNFEKMPPLLQKNWRELAFKWALRYAAENNLASVTWTPGWMQTERYGLSEAVEAIRWSSPAPQTDAYALGARKFVEFELQGEGTLSLELGEDGLVKNTYGSGDMGNAGTEGWVGQPLSAVVGKDLAARIEADVYGASTVEDLTVGGEGLARLYDQDFKNVVNKLPAVKKSGGRVTEFPLVSDVIHVPAPARGGKAKLADSVEKTPVPGVAITDQVRAAVLGGQALFQGEQGKRGKFRQGADRQVFIELLENADLSTFVHETGHLYLEVLGDIATELGLQDPATLTASQAAVQRDYRTLLDWFGVASRDEIKVEHHEQFARGFEAYLLEGKAPSSQLRETFARFRTWLTTIYKTATSLNVQLTDDVRGVFDRLMAGDQAIEAAHQEALVAPMFATAAEAGMSDAEFALYRKTALDAHQRAQDSLAARLLQEYKQERSKAYRERRKALTDQVRDELANQPIYRALLALQRGQWPDGSEVGSIVKMNRQAIVDQFGEEMLRSLPKPWVYQVEGGITPDMAAELFGFSSGDELLRALAQSTRLEAAVASTVRDRLAAEFGDMRSDGSLKDLAKRAVQENGYEKVLQAELRAIEKLARTVSPHVRQAVAETKTAEREKAAKVIDPLKAEKKAAREAMWAGLRGIRGQFPLDTAREVAAARIAKMRLRDINPQSFWTAARQAGQRALEAAIVNDYNGALVAKQQQLLAVELYRAANQAIEEATRLVRYARRFEETATRARLGKAGHTYLDQVDAILEKFDLAQVSNKNLDKRATLREFLDELQAQGLPVDGIPAEAIEAAQKVSYREVPLEQLRQLRETIAQIEHLARLKNKLLRAQKDRAFQAVVTEVVEQLDKGKKAELPLEYRPSDKRRAAIADWFANHSKIAMLARLIDQHVDGGPLWRAIIRPLNEAADIERERRTVEGKAYAAILEAHYPGRELAKLGEMQHIPQIRASLSKEARLAVALNWGNETSRQRLVNDPRRKWSEPQVQAILDTLDARDWRFVQATWDYLNTYWDEIAAKQKRVTGLAPEKVEAVPVITKHGTFAGGYYPLAYDHRMSARAGQVAQASEAKLAMQAAYVRTTTRRGHVETRLQHVELPVRLELSVMFEHLDRVIHDLTHHETLIDVTRLLRDKQVSAAFLESVGEPVYKQFTNALSAIAANGRSGIESSVLDRAAAWMKTGTQIAGLGFNLWTAVQQPFGVFNGMQRVGARWVIRGLVHWMKDAAHMENTATWIRERSVMMRNRSATINQDINELHRTLSEPGGWFDNMVRAASRDHVTQQSIVDSFLWHIGLAQQAADIPTWLGAYEKHMAGGATEADAVAMADQAVLDSQGGGEVKDLAGVQRGGPVARLFMTFYSYGSTIYNATRDAAGQAKWSSPRSVAKFLGDLTLLYILPATASVMMAHLLGKNDDDDPESILKDIGTESLSVALNTMVILREFGGLLRDGGAARGWSGPSGARFMQLVYNVANQANQGQLDAGFWKALNSMGGVVLRYPSTQVQKTVDGLVALEEGRTSNPFVLLTGPPPKGK